MRGGGQKGRGVRKEHEPEGKTTIRTREVYRGSDEKFQPTHAVLYKERSRALQKRSNTITMTPTPLPGLCNQILAESTNYPSLEVLPLLLRCVVFEV
jgi:hypothetical protein